MKEGINTFLERPFAGVGAGQFKNYNPPGRKERWRETHNAIIQVASETGIFGLVAFVFLIVRAIGANVTAKRLLKRPHSRAPDDVSEAMEDSDREFLYAHTVAMTAGLIGWLRGARFGVRGAAA